MIDIIDIGSIISDFVRVGYNAAVKDYDPPQDRLRLSDVKKWLKFRKIEFKAFQELEKKGLIQGCCCKLSFVLLKGRDTESFCYHAIKSINDN